MSKKQNVKAGITDFQIKLDDAIRDGRMVLLVAVIAGSGDEQDTHVRLTSGKIESGIDLVNGLEAIKKEVLGMQTDIFKILSA